MLLGQVINLNIYFRNKTSKSSQISKLLRNNRVKRKLLKYLEVSLSRVMEKVGMSKTRLNVLH